MEYGDYMIPRLKELLKQRRVRGYSRKRKAELIPMLRDSDSRPSGLSDPQPALWLPPPTWGPTRSQCTRPPHPMRPPPPSPSQAWPSVSFRPDRIKTTTIA